MIHTFSLMGQHIALDIHSGSVHLADEVSLEAIRLYEKQTREEVCAALMEQFPGNQDTNEESIRHLLDQLDELKAQGKLYSEEYFQDHFAEGDRKQSAIKALCLHVAHACNLACSYCFAGQGQYQGKAQLMSLETGKKALDFLIAHSGDKKHLEVDFFGGEPLLNWPVVKELVSYARQLEKKQNKIFRFTLTTNGVLLDDEVTDFCLAEMQNVVLSLDGRKEVHDRFRVNHQGEGSYDLVVPKFQSFAKKRGEQGYYVRGTFTKHNLDFLQDIIHLADLGFTQISMEPVVSPPNNPEALDDDNLPMIFKQYEGLAQTMLERKRIGKGFDFYHFNIDLEHGPCIHKRLHGCGSGVEYLAVTPEGDLYPCHQFVGDNVNKIGNLQDGIINHKLRKTFAKNNLYAHPECQNCWAKFYCAGGCAANAYHATGSIKGVYDLGCKIFMKRIECALALKASLIEEGLD